MERDLVGQEERLVEQDPNINEQCNLTIQGTEKLWIEPRAETLKMYEIRIQFLSTGCLVTVGCKTIPFPTIEEAMKEINEYISNPREAINKWNKIFNEYK